MPQLLYKIVLIYKNIVDNDNDTNFLAKLRSKMIAYFKKRTKWNKICLPSNFKIQRTVMADQIFSGYYKKNSTTAGILSQQDIT